MATQKGVWNLQQVRDKQLQDLWGYRNAGQLYIWGGDSWNSGSTAQNNRSNYSSPIQIPGDWALDDSIFASGNKLSMGETGTLGAIKNDGTLWGWGANSKGWLGQNNTTQYSSPVQVPGTTWKTMSLAGTNSQTVHCIKTDGTMWGWGDNDNGQLAVGSKTEYSSPVQIPGTTWKAAITGGHKFMGFKTDGTLWVCGRNTDGQLGLNNKTDCQSPVQIPGTTWGDSFACQDATGAAIKTDGTLWTWGDNASGGLGHNNTTEYSSPKQVGSDTTWSKIGSGIQNCMLGLKTDGTLWGWGDNDQGQLGVNSRTFYSSPIQIGSDTTWDNVEITMGYHAVAHKTDGTLWVWGSNGNAQLGQGQASAQLAKVSSPVQVPGTWEKTIGAGGGATIGLKN